MRYSAQHKEETRRKILDAAARRFRAQGYDGLGIDGLAAAAGVTNGAFYGNFASKADAYREIVVGGLDALLDGIAGFQQSAGEDWVSALAEFYFSPPKIDCAEDVCALPSFAPEAARAPAATREAFQTALLRVHQRIADGLGGVDADQRAWRMLALFAGGVTLARAVPDAALSRAIAEIARDSVKALAEPEQDA